MDSVSAKAHRDKLKQEEIRRQIALLQAQLDDTPENVPPPPSSPKRANGPKELVPASPSPRKKRKFSHPSAGPSNSSHLPKQQPRPSTGRPSASHNKPAPPSKQPSKPSTVLDKLASLKPSTSSDQERSAERSRTTAFSQSAPTADAGPSTSIKRDADLTIIEDIQIGPYEHTPLAGDPDFNTLEPHSGIHLSSRTIPHDEIQEYLRARYYLSPSRLYSVARLLPSRQGYDVPVDGDWVTIAVVAERGPVKYTKAPVALKAEDDVLGGDSDDERDAGKPPAHMNGAGSGKNGAPQEWKKRKRDDAAKDAAKTKGKKYVHMKLIDFGSRSAASSSATGGKAVIRGDAFLSLMLFEADSFSTEVDADGKETKLYRGGSKGAFEVLSRVKEGDVIALLNPKILKPFQRSGDNPHPVDNILAVTPESASSILVIGRSRDLGMCTVSKRDGKPCGRWCDKRVSDVCEIHIQNAVQSRRAGRAEFSAGTSGMTTTAKIPKHKSAYDPTRQWGLKPNLPEGADSGGSTYVVSGHIVNSSNALSISETMGREGQARAARKADTDRALMALLERDKDGMRAVVKAREFGGGNQKAGKAASNPSSSSSKGKEKEKMPTGSSEDTTASKDKSTAGSRVFSASVIKQLGFNPTLKNGERPTDGALRDKLDALSALQAARGAVQLGPRPGPKIRSGVVAPPDKDRKSSKIPAQTPPPPSSSEVEPDMIDLDASSDIES